MEVPDEFRIRLQLIDTVTCISLTTIQCLSRFVLYRSWNCASSMFALMRNYVSVDCKPAPISQFARDPPCPCSNQPIQTPWFHRAKRMRDWITRWFSCRVPQPHLLESLQLLMDKSSPHSLAARRMLLVMHVRSAARPGARNSKSSLLKELLCLCIERLKY
jgi:hypothetical protein